MATICHPGFLEVQNINCRYGSEGQGPICVIVPNFVLIGQTIAEI